MKILVIHSFYKSDVPSGENLVVINQISALRLAGHNVELFQRHSDEIKNLRNMIQVGIRTASGLDHELNRFIAKFNPDVIHLHNTFPNIGTNWIGANSRRLLVTHHNYRSMCASAWFKYNNKDCFDCILKNPIYSLFRRCYQNSFLKTLPLFFRNRKGVDSPLLHQNATHIVLNQQGATFLNKLLPDLKVRVVPNFSAIASDSKKIKTELYFCYVGRLSHEKGFCNLISNWPEGVKLKVVGSGECETCGKSSTENSLIEFVGLKAQGETREIISGATGLVVPSQNSEGIPTVILEAISCGTPLILSEMMHVSEELVQSKVGYQVPADFNSEIMLTAIQCVIANYEVFSKNAFNLHDQKFSQSIWLTLIESAYREVANAAKP